MIIRNKHTGQYIYEARLINGKVSPGKVSVLWTNDKRNACHFSSNLQDKWKEGFETFQKAMKLELELIEE